MTDVALPVAPAHAPPAVPDFEIVPRKGLPIVAVVFVALVAAIPPTSCGRSSSSMSPFGAAWTIIDLFLGLVLGPIIGRMSIPARDRVHDPADAEDAC